VSSERKSLSPAVFPWVNAAASAATGPASRILGLECGFVWTTWAVLEGRQLVDGGVFLSDDYLEPADIDSMTRTELVTRRLYGMHLGLVHLMDRYSPQCVADWSPNPHLNDRKKVEDHLEFTYRHGQSQGMIKNLCFQRGLTVMGVQAAKATQAVTGDPESARAAVEATLMERLVVSEFAAREFNMDDGRTISDNCAGALAIAYAAQAQLRV
jgi:Holliday junction resolvasome RuvABC endonuclease subunit